MQTQRFRVRFTMTPTVLGDSFNRWFTAMKEIIVQYVSQGWELDLESGGEGPIGIGDYEVIVWMKRAA